MCGIAGATGSNQDGLVSRMAAALVHRGPDGEGQYSDDHISLGFRRLSIVDVEGGHQPIASNSGELILICNGEIYNSPTLRKQIQRDGYRFKTNSDVEIILPLYEKFGVDCVLQLEGMFAFALWDKRRRHLMLARDHMGQKPLYYYHDGAKLFFASEVQALLASGLVKRELDIDALWHYVSLRFMPDHHSLIRGIKKLPAATYLTFRDGQIETNRYWDLDFRNKMSASAADATDFLDERLRQTTRSHLLSDVPVGGFISGGIDSTTIACMASRESAAPFPVFSIGVEESSFDEVPFARKVAEANNLPFISRRARPDLAALLPVMVHHLAEPADPYGVGVFLVSKLAAEHVKVVLCGDGGDESFGGYDRYLGQRLVEIYSWLPKTFRRALLSRLFELVPETFRYKSLAQRLRWLHEMSEFSGGERYSRALGFLRFTPETKLELFTDNAVQQLTDSDSTERVLRFFDAPNVDDVIDRMLHTDLMTRVPDHNLVMSDRMSMAASLEVRSPFVDPRLVEFAASLPVDLKIKSRTLKYLLRRVAARYVPREISRLPKQGFGFPIGKWMRDELRQPLKDRLACSRFVTEGIFNRSYVQRILDEHLSGTQDHSYRLWLLLGLEIWHELYLEGKNPDAVTL
jgi:asparagine synthase (glutamine-hydrolysing)